MNAYVKENVLYKPMLRGYEFKLIVRAQAGYFQNFDSIKADFKKTKGITAPVIIATELGDGITVTSGVVGGTTYSFMTIIIPDTDTEDVTLEFLYTDIKAQNGSNAPVLILDAIIPVLDKATL
jgi:hypothetical protein